jgi:hypothetical protein
MTCDIFPESECGLDHKLNPLAASILCPSDGCTAALVCALHCKPYCAHLGNKRIYSESDTTVPSPPIPGPTWVSTDDLT